jgi:D-alanyl-D-alanine carboxypeptidase
MFTGNRQNITALIFFVIMGIVPFFFALQKMEPGEKEFQALDKYFANKTLKDEFSGVVLVAKDGKILYEKAFGYADKNFKIPNRTDTKFNLASLNKLFTAVVISQLVEQGKLNFDDTIGKYLDGFSKDAAEKVTIRHLLQMKSGWGDYWNNEYFKNNFTKMRKVSDYLELIQKMPLEFEPGTKQIHSNTGFIVLGAIIEKITGMDYFDYVRENIYKPAGMNDTDSYDRDSDVSNMATGYTNLHPADPVKKGFKWSDRCFLRPKGGPDGGGYSTALDMLKFDTALRSHKFLGEKYFNYLNNRFEGEIDRPLENPDTIRLSAGGSMGIETWFGRDLQDGYTIIILSNYDMQREETSINEVKKAIGKL